ncbi:MAG: efflux RND transporter periplasmic adaptor subunit [Gemmatimonadetes bacterium]|nr:efflux RND transporter periplasmic adaptor subunit [Gemmatimonadota bacterium]
MRRRLLALGAASAAVLAGGCTREQPPPLYEPVAVARRDIVVSAEAAGTVEPILVVDVKSKASGEILELRVETGDIAQEGDLLVRVDPRDPQNALAQAEADLDVARASLANAEAQKRRADQMFAAQVLSEQEHENANLQYANARAQLVRGERAVQTARDQLDDTNVRAPIAGTVIQKSVERGQVIASATREVSGGTVLLRMADLDEVQVRTLVDETDIGKVQPGMRATITVDAYPNRPFEGSVLKIEPQSQTQQNVTMFPVLIRIANEAGLLRPGMNAEVELHIGSRQGVLAIPNAALRTARDVGSAARVLGLDPEAVDRALAAQDSIARANPPRLAATTPGSRTSQPPATPEPAAPGSFGSRMPRELAAQPAPSAPPGGATTGATGGQNPPAAAPGAAPALFGPQGGPPGMRAGGFRLPDGITAEQARAAFQKRMSGEPLTAQDSAVLARIREARQQASRQQTTQAGGQEPRRRFGVGNSFQFGGSYIVFVLRDGRAAAVRIRTGLTDLDYSEVVSGLTEQDTVLLLPSASLVQQQRDMRDRLQRMTGGGMPGMRQQAPAAGAGATGSAGAAGGARPGSGGGRP